MIPTADARLKLEDMNWSQRGGNPSHTGSVNWKVGPYFPGQANPIVLEGVIEGISTWGDQVIANIKVPSTIDKKPLYNVSSVTKDNRFLWKTDINSKPIGIPAIANKTILILSENGNLLKLDPYTGKVLMDSNIISEGATDVTVSGNYIVIGGKSQVLCLDLRSNLRKWHFKTEDIPQPVSVCGSYVVINHQTKLTCLNLFSGKLVWEVSQKTKAIFTSTPVIGSGLVFISTTDSKLRAFSLFTGMQVWSKDSVSVTSVTYDGNNIFFPSTNYAYCLKASNGQEVWKSMPSGKPLLVWSQLASTKSCLIVPCKDGKIFMLDKSNGKQLSSVSVTSQIAVEIAVGNDFFTVPDNTFKGNKGNNLWFFVSKDQ